MSSFDSVSEIFVPQDTLWKTRKWHWFGGETLPTDWAQVNGSGVGTFAMADAINEGFSIISGAGSNNNSEITFGNIKHIDAQAHICIAEFRRVGSVGQDSFGVTDQPSGILGSSVNNQLSIFDSTNAANKQLFFNNGGAPASVIDLGIPIDTVFHSYKTEGKIASAEGSIDGVLLGTATTDLPTGSVQPTFFVRRFTTGGGHEGRIRQAEVFST